MGNIDNINNLRSIYEFYNLLRQISRNIEISRDKSTKNYNLSGAQFSLLYNVWLKEKCNYTELAKESGLAKNTVSILVKPLIRQNLLVQIFDSKDARVIQLALSPKGEELIQTILENMAATIPKELKLLSERLSSGNGEDISSLLRLVLDFWKK
ncbi:MarR family winged helix-turn-helix transcriptional regulator [Desulfitobacterium sp. AusDCA]|uniref:MarR family winged helix-turn-helix transcriptional regulator n=1 Tax=Desulfitobacterium sp. AusDCA TaxID=3240383 RepID=UPI003DA74AB4